MMQSCNDNKVAPMSVRCDSHCGGARLCFPFPSSDCVCVCECVLVRLAGVSQCASISSATISRLRCWHPRRRQLINRPALNFRQVENANTQRMVAYFRELSSLRCNVCSDSSSAKGPWVTSSTEGCDAEGKMETKKSAPKCCLSVCVWLSKPPDLGVDISLRCLSRFLYA